MGIAPVAKAAKKKAKEPRWETHVYLTEQDYNLVKQIADEESRSVTMQIQHFIRTGLRVYDKPPARS